MQSSWNPSPGGTGPDDSHGNWASGYGYQAQAGQFDDSPQTWSQPGQPMYSSVAPNSTPADAGFYPNPTHQGGAILGDSINGVSAVPRGNFAGQAGLPQYQPVQNTFDPAFESLQQEVFGQRGKLDLGQGLGDLNQAQSHQGQPSAQGFSQQAFASYPSRNEQAFHPAVAGTSSLGSTQQAAAYERMHQQPQQQVQQQAHQQQPHQQQPHHQQPQQQQPFQHTQSFSQPSQHLIPGQHTFEHTPAAYPSAVIPEAGLYHNGSGHGHLEHQAQYRPQTYLPQQSAPFSQHQGPEVPQGSPVHHEPVSKVPQNIPQPTPPVSGPSPSAQAPTTQGVKRDSEQVGTPQSAQDSSDFSTTTESAPKKRKQVLKNPSGVQRTGTPDPHSQSTIGLRGTGENDASSLPVSTDEELAAIAAFKKRTNAAKAKFPAVLGAPRLVTAGTAKLPTPKSYDKLAPLVALPSQSGRRIFPELERSLACEIQGVFSDRFRPSPQGRGLEDRRRDAESLLAEYDRSMESLGNRRPKYTEYPHAFKEQLKTDEALRTKAGRLARKMAEEERNKPARPETRPLDPVEGAAWDIIGFVHIPPSATRTTALLAGAVQQAGEYIMARRGEMTRAKQEVDQAVKDKLDSELPSLTAEAELKKEVLHRTLDTANKVGDEAVLENLGGHGKLVLSLVNLLIHCIKASDFAGKLPKAALSLMANFRMTQRVVTQTNFDNIRRRLSDKGDAEVKELLDTITSRIRKDPNADASPRKPASTSSVSTSKVKPASSKLSTENPSTKRARLDDMDSRVSKKQAVEGSGSAHPVASNVSAQPKAALPKSRPISLGILPGKSRPVSKPVSKPAAAKVEPSKPESGSSSKPEAKKLAGRPEPKPETTRSSKPASSSTGLGGIASLLDSINAPKAQPKPPPKAPKEEPVKGETPEQRDKRLRKQARRQLRVSWKADNELEQVRFFHAEDEEEDEGGFDSRMIRDAADDKREGMVLKRGMVLDEDEDEDEDLPYRPWLEPAALDLSTIPPDYRKKTYQTRGGDLVVETDEQKFIADREKKVLMAFYQDIDDIPPTPKSPSARAAEPSAEMKIGHLPRDDARFEEIHRRWKEVQQFGRNTALQYAAKRIESKQHPSNKVNSVLDALKFAPSGSGPSASTTTAPDPRSNLSTMTREEQVLTLLSSHGARQWRSTESLTTKRRYDYADPRVQHAADLVEDIASKLKGPYPADEPPAWLRDNAEAVREWWLGYNKDAAAKAKRDADEKARASAEHMAASTNQAGLDAWAAYYAQQQAYAPYMAILQQLQGGQQAAAAAPAAPVAQSGGGHDPLQAVLAALGHTQGPTTQATQPPSTNAMPQIHPNDPTYQQLMMLTQMAQQSAGDHGGAAAYGSGSGREWDRERDRDRDREHERDEDDRRGDGNGGQRKHKAATTGTLPPHRPVNRALIGTKPCVFYKQGTCARGDQCTFRHE